MNIIETKLPGVVLIEPKIFGDARGYFFEMHSAKKYLPWCGEKSFVQDNVSCSAAGVLRGLHYQLEHPQGKLVTVLRGAVFDVVVDIRRHSPTFQQWIGVELSEENHRQLYIPPGFAHGFYVLREETYFHYKCTDYYHPASERGILWSDEALGIAWPLLSAPIISPKDEIYPTMQDISSEDLPVYNVVSA